MKNAKELKLEYTSSVRDPRKAAVMFAGNSIESSVA